MLQLPAIVLQLPATRWVVALPLLPRLPSPSSLTPSALTPLASLRIERLRLLSISLVQYRIPTTSARRTIATAFLKSLPPSLALFTTGLSTSKREAIRTMPQTTLAYRAKSDVSGRCLYIYICDVGITEQSCNATQDYRDSPINRAHPTHSNIVTRYSLYIQACRSH